MAGKQVFRRGISIIKGNSDNDEMIVFNMRIEFWLAFIIALELFAVGFLYCYVDFFTEAVNQAFRHLTTFYE